jgi:hypothetical protein
VHVEAGLHAINLNQYGGGAPLDSGVVRRTEKVLGTVRRPTYLPSSPLRARHPYLGVGVVATWKMEDTRQVAIAIAIEISR